MKSLIVLFYFIFSSAISTDPIVLEDTGNERCKKTKALKTLNEKKIFETTFVYKLDGQGREISYDLYWEDGSRKWAFQKIYNDDGLVNQLARFDENNVYDGYYYISYDENNFKIKETIFDKNGKIESYKKYKNDDEGKPLRYDYYNSKKVMTEYWTFEYDEKGNNTKKYIYTADGTLDSYFTMQYDENNLEQFYRRDNASGEEMYSFYFSYECEY